MHSQRRDTKVGLVGSMPSPHKADLHMNTITADLLHMVHKDVRATDGMSKGITADMVADMAEEDMNRDPGTEEVMPHPLLSRDTMEEEDMAVKAEDMVVEDTVAATEVECHNREEATEEVSPSCLPCYEPLIDLSTLGGYGGY